MITRRYSMVLLAALAGCTRTVVAEKPVPVHVQVRVECPTKAERERLRAARPKRLRDQVMPTDPVERNGRNMAQLGMYEAEGAWADQVDTALDRCQ